MLSGIDVTWLGQASTPTVEIAVFRSGSDGGIIITASHNPAEWNALKLLDSRGEFLSAEDGGKILAIADSGNFKYCGNDDMGTKKYEDDWNRKHIDMVLSHPLTDRKAISSARLTVAADCVNSVGGMIIPDLLKELGVSRIIPVNCEPTGLFSHNPEPLPGNLTELAETVVREKAALPSILMSTDWLLSVRTDRCSVRNIPSLPCQIICWVSDLAPRSPICRHREP
jgi:phosphomannomutase